MTLEQAIEKINYALRGLDDETPTEGSDEWNYWTSVLNTKKDELYESLNLATAYNVQSLGTIVAATEPAYNIPTSFMGVSGDKEDVYAGSDAYVIKTDGKRINFRLIKPEERTRSELQVFIAGVNPQQLFFTDEIEADDNIVDGELFLPGYYLPDDVEDPTDTLPVPRPNWLVLATAAEIAFNDIVYEDRAEGLNAKANNLYQAMVRSERRGTYSQPRTVPVKGLQHRIRR